MNKNKKAQKVESVKCVQLDGGSRENLKALEQDYFPEALEARQEETRTRNRLELYTWYLKRSATCQ
jgi:hypothetical protein